MEVNYIYIYIKNPSCVIPKSISFSLKYISLDTRQGRLLWTEDGFFLE